MGLRFQQFRRSRPRPTALRLVRMMLGYPPKPERQVRGMSALPPKADIGTKPRNVHFVPIAESAAMTPPNYSGSSTNRETGSGPYGRGTANKMWMSRKFG